MIWSAKETFEASEMPGTIKDLFDREVEPGNAYELLGKPLFDPNRGELLAAIRAAVREVMALQNHRDVRISERAIQLQNELGRAEAIFSNAARRHEYDNELLAQLREQLFESATCGADRNPAEIRKWLAREQRIHPDRLMPVAEALLSSEQEAIAFDDSVDERPTHDSGTDEESRETPSSTSEKTPIAHGNEWYYRMLGDEFGPYSAYDLLQLVDQGLVDPLTDVRQGTSGQWVPAWNVRTSLAGSQPIESPPPTASTAIADDTDLGGRREAIRTLKAHQPKLNVAAAVWIIGGVISVGAIILGTVSTIASIDEIPGGTVSERNYAPDPPQSKAKTKAKASTAQSLAGESRESAEVLFETKVRPKSFVTAEQLYASATTAMQGHEYDSANQLFQQATDAFHRSQADAPLANDVGKFKEEWLAESANRRSGLLSQSAQKFVADATQIAAVADSLESQGDLERAALLYREAITLIEKANGKADSTHAQQAALTQQFDAAVVKKDMPGAEQALRELERLVPDEPSLPELRKRLHTLSNALTAKLASAQAAWRQLSDRTDARILERHQSSLFRDALETAASAKNAAAASNMEFATLQYLNATKTLEKAVAGCKAYLALKFVAAISNQDADTAKEFLADLETIAPGDPIIPVLRAKLTMAPMPRQLTVTASKLPKPPRPLRKRATSRYPKLNIRHPETGATRTVRLNQTRPEVLTLMGDPNCTLELDYKDGHGDRTADFYITHEYYVRANSSDERMVNVCLVVYNHREVAEYLNAAKVKNTWPTPDQAQSALDQEAGSLLQEFYPFAD